MNGMFAFAIWDPRAAQLFLARDRMGVKPLYYADTPQAFVFGSEVKSLFASGLVEPRAREEALAEYLLFRQVAGPDGALPRRAGPAARLHAHVARRRVPDRPLLVAAAAARAAIDDLRRRASAARASCSRNQ